ncbi:YdhK family protein [Bacillus sp. B-jedd]|uniref:YdhK family protein n=1 Tax=Bacillus sp. B-jedd TaxID=1476857 RepID=UPI000515581F|nr:YdhK family protein [Bacillus sp. B-jedd]CEG29007.1 putative lipoprotein [Bacillus sp. B-jedd]
MFEGKRFLKGIVSLFLMLALSACGGQNDQSAKDKTKQPPTSEKTSGSHEGMEHSGSGEVPAGLKEAANPKYKVGSKAVINTDHMPGMNGAVATISGAFDTTAYVVSYTPTTGGKKVTGHKWVIHEELENPGNEPLKPGDEAKMTADHMKGMKGATATIESAEKTTVYMVDYTPTTGGEKVTNHKWVTESELSPTK